MLAKRKLKLKELSEKVGVSTVNLSILKQGKVKAIRFRKQVLGGFDSSGRKIRNLWEGHIPESQIELNWDGNDDNQKRVSSGLYILRAEFRDRPGLTVKIIRY